MAAPNFPRLRGKDAQQSRVQDSIAQQLTPVATALARTPIMGAPPPGWQAPSLLSAFANLGGQHAVAGYHRDALGYVHGKGSLQGSGAGTASDAPIYILPMGYRPAEIQRFPVFGGSIMQWVNVLPTGVVTVGAVMGSGEVIDIAFTFLAEQ